MAAEGGAAGFLYMQKDHDVVAVHIELEVIVEHILVAESCIGNYVIGLR